MRSLTQTALLEGISVMGLFTFVALGALGVAQALQALAGLLVAHSPVAIARLTCTSWC